MTADGGLFGGAAGKFIVISPDCSYRVILT
jgi:hypothetical protein